MIRVLFGIFIGIGLLFGNYLTIGTGPINGLYYPTATSICNFLNRRGGPVKCTSSSSIGSTYNLYYLQQRLYDLIIAQADAAAVAIRGEGVFKGHPFKQLRVLLALYPEYFTIVSRQGSGVGDFLDLRGRRIGIGDPRSGTEITFQNVLKYSGISQNQLKVKVYAIGEMSNKLRRGIIDAFLFVVGHPNYAVKESVYLLGKRVKLVPLPENLIGRLVKSPYFYNRGEILGADYGLSGKTPTITTKALLLTTAEMPEEEA
ncbi:MAG: TAXI family TRAP transporter solute-binding subunit, partial [Campylobacterales bacterium]